MTPRLLLAAALWLGVSGCLALGTTLEGNPIDENKLTLLVPGVTTRAEVLSLFGSPLEIDRADITGLAEQALSRFQGEALNLQIDPSLFNDVYIYEQRRIDRWLLITGIVNYVEIDEVFDRLSVFFRPDGTVLGVGWTPGIDPDEENDEDEDDDD